MFRSYNDVIHRKPIITKALTQFVIFGAGDVFCQFIEKGQSKKASKKFDEVRSLKQAIFGFVFAPYGHFHFCKVIPYLFPVVPGKSTNLRVIKRMTYDQTIHASFFTVIFYYYMGLMNGKETRKIIEDIKGKYLPTMIDNWKVWPLAMVINYKFIPLQYSLLYTNILGFFWLSYMSYLQNIKFANVC